jgi:hypothetical protein
MAKLSITDVKSKFETGDRPSGADFVDLIDTLSANSTDLGSAGNNETLITGLDNATVVDSFSATEWRSVKYFISISAVTDGRNKSYSTDLSILIDKNDINVTEYGSLDNDGDIGTVSVSKGSGVISLVVTPNPNFKPITVRYFRTGLKA